MLALEEEASATAPAPAAPPAANSTSPPPPGVQLAAAEISAKRAMGGSDDAPAYRSAQWAASKSGTFALTFVSYVLYHACRKAFSAIKGEMSAEQWMHSAVYPRGQQGEMYGLLDTLFMGCYAVGLYVRCVKWV